MEKFDILVVGGSTTGSWFARRMAERGHKVLVIEKQKADNVSREYDIFHMTKKEMEQFGLEIPDEDAKEFGFFFDGSPMLSPYGNYPKKTVPNTIVGLHKHDYIMMMNDLAEKAGAEIRYGAAFTDFIREGKKIVGAKYKTDDGEKEVFADLIADCTGIPAVARTKMPDTSTVENYKLTPKDIFYVVLYYAVYKDKNIDPMDYHASLLNYKAVWSAPSGNPHGAILGIGGNYSYEYSEEVFKDFRKNVPWPEYTVDKVEKGMTPYRRGIYSFVDDNFIALGDTACLTKPTCGEGCTSSLVQCKIAVDVIDGLLKEGKALTKENMWCINKEYLKQQGIAFDSLRALLKGVVSTSYDEAEYMFKNDIIFNEKILGSGGEDLQISPADIAKIVSGIATGVLTGKIKASTVKKIVTGLLQSGEITKLYEQYPETPAGYWEWKKKADALWEKIGPMSDICDPAILKRLGIK
ncbi:MAG: NAD(P)/FAD-dependent oxidoreductase [Acutalibacteraceae bacterium]|nr:NAD(P)/FAD-dependent oxidoreductase [Acutalibacteraceae bacterium]